MGATSLPPWVPNIRSCDYVDILMDQELENLASMGIPQHVRKDPPPLHLDPTHRATATMTT